MAFTFGIASEINVEVATVAFCATICFLITFEYITRLLEKYLGGSPTYNQMLQRLYKELMSNGFIGFTLAMYQASNTSTSSKAWTQVVDFVGYIIFFVAIFFVAHALYIMVLSLMSAKQYEMYHSMSLANVLQELSDMEEDLWAKTCFYMKYLPISSLRTRAEFKIIYALFRDTFWLPSDFNYGLYLSGCFERYSLKIASIGKSSYAMMLLLCILNYLRIKYGGSVLWNCRGFKHGEDDDAAGRYGTSNRCSLMHLQLYFFCGLMLSLYVVIVYVISRVYVLRLMAHSGVTELYDYAEFLAIDESTMLKVDMQRNIEIDIPDKESNRRTRNRRMSVGTLRTNIDQMSPRGDKDNGGGGARRRRTGDSFVQPRSSPNLSDRVTTFLTPIFSPRNQGDSDDDSQPAISRQARKSTFRKVAPTHDIESSGSELSGRRKSVQLTLSGGPTGRVSSICSVTSFNAENSMSAIEQFKFKKQGRQLSDVKSNRKSGIMRTAMSVLTGASKALSTRNIVSKTDSMKLSEDFSHIYLFNSPTMYFRAVELTIMLNSLYLSMWVTNFISVVSTETKNPVVWQLLMMCPFVIVLPVVGEIVKTASALSAIAELELDVMGYVLEEMEDQKQLLDQLQASTQNRFGSATRSEAKEIIEAIYESIDVYDTDALNKAQVREFLRALHLHYSNDKFRRLFKAMDFNRDGSLSCHELYKVLCPKYAEEDEREAREEAIKSLQITKENRTRIGSSPSFLGFIPSLSLSSDSIGGSRQRASVAVTPIQEGHGKVGDQRSAEFVTRSGSTLPRPQARASSFMPSRLWSFGTDSMPDSAIVPSRESEVIKVQSSDSG